MKNSIFALVLFLFFVPAHALSTKAFDRPKLVLLLVIDQFRADYLMRFQSRFMPPQLPSGKVGGFRFLTESGAYYPFATYEHLQCMTGPGHATVLTGAYPYASGIPTNYWYDREKKDRVYCTEDLQFKTVGVAKAKPHVGTSPSNLKASTIGDEIKNSGYPAKVVSIAVKDRAAILMGGHRPDLVLWHDFESFRWVSSEYYLKNQKLPEWVESINQKIESQKNKMLEWKPEGKETGYSDPVQYSAGRDPSFGIGVGFPHQIAANTMGVLRSPFGVEMTFDTALAAVKQMKLGNGQWTDLLAVSISSHDYLAHSHGPNSTEIEEMTIQEDRLISKFLNDLKAQIPGGLKNVVIVLTADHGGGHVPEWLNKAGVDAGRINEEDLSKQTNEVLEKKFGKLSDGQKYVLFGLDFNQYLNLKAISKKGLTISEVENEIKAFLKQQSWVADVFTSHDYEIKRLPLVKKGEQISKTYFPGRSGDVYIFANPNYIPTGDTATHLTGYNYDCTVPIVMVGSMFKRGKFAETAHVVDIASTLSFVLGITPPNMAEGRVLSEAIFQNK